MVLFLDCYLLAANPPPIASLLIFESVCKKITNIHRCIIGKIYGVWVDYFSIFADWNFMYRLPERLTPLGIIRTRLIKFFFSSKITWFREVMPPWPGCHDPWPMTHMNWLMSESGIRFAKFSDLFLNRKFVFAYVPEHCAVNSELMICNVLCIS